MPEPASSATKTQKMNVRVETPALTRGDTIIKFIRCNSFLTYKLVPKSIKVVPPINLVKLFLNVKHINQVIASSKAHKVCAFGGYLIDTQAP